ncbi:hypothetical protein BGP78_09735 [Pseudoalteromonas sp. MSK9-3]|uniref:hypothetical protein n=1 Tax=Pseudoalteromonas sp. MSK9-3 TaxID=1897633 RepID=UPI000E6C21B6|nr:hypothetical protein [Pseudoalteromonas sp. MSK9-3]RJE77172.1 hypothetical protein BGP78_09735 [Pseudoalteromonas sp. MSK9-3]
MNKLIKHVNSSAQLLLLLGGIGAIASAAANGEHLIESQDLKITKWNPEKPWRELHDPRTALNDPDHYAWQLFVSLNWPANEKRCKPNKKKWLGEEGPVVWEVWREKTQTFLADAQTPKSWKLGCDQGNVIALPSGVYSIEEDEGVYVNRTQYNYTRDNKLYSLDQQERLVANGVEDLSFPLGSKSVKSSWVVINEIDKPRYHWHEAIRNGETVIYGLTALHIVSKENPTWFWSTFEHVDNESRWSQVYPEAFLGWQVPSKDSAACPSYNLSCNEIPVGYELEGTKWKYFRLRGTQTGFVDTRGRPTLLTNSRIEYKFDQQTMSCISCHAAATKGLTGPPMPVLGGPGTVNEQNLFHGYTGTLDPAIFEDSNGELIPYLGLDYVWMLRNAKRESDQP